MPPRRAPSRPSGPARAAPARGRAPRSQGARAGGARAQARVPRGWPSKPRHVSLGPGAAIDPGVLLGYPAARRLDEPRLSVGPGARLRSGTVLYEGSRIGAGFETGHGTVVREQCVLGDRVKVWTGTVLDYGCVLGDDVKVHTNCYVAQRSVLGPRSFLAPGVVLANDLFPGRARSAELMTGPRIGPGAQLGCNVTVLPFVRIGAGTVVGAGAVVARDLPDGVVAVGNPARPVRKVAELSDAEVEARLAARLRSWEGP